MMGNRLTEVLALVILMSLAACFRHRQSSGGQEVAEVGPLILYDRAHSNFDSPGRWETVTRYLSRYGYIVHELHAPFESASLLESRIVVIKNALSPVNVEHWALPTPSAFSSQEIEVLRKWVTAGGALLLVIEHMPMAGAARQLAAAFGIEVSNGFVVNAAAIRGFDAEAIGLAGFLEFQRADGSLADHPITSGRGLPERISSVATDAGSALLLPSGALSLLTLGRSAVSLLPEVAWEFDDETPRQAVGGWSQGGVMCVGAGRLAVLGDAALLIAPELLESGFETERAAQNPQFTLNLFRWLSGGLPCE